MSAIACIQNSEIPSALLPSCRTIRIGLLGYGRIGQAVAATIDAERDLFETRGLALAVVYALVRDPTRRRAAPRIPLVAAAADPLASRLDVVVEVLGGIEPARTLVARALAHGIPVVTANKTLVAHHGPELRALAARHDTTLAFDAAVVAGVPFLGLLARRPLLASARRIAGVVNGSSHAIVEAIEAGATFESALADAVAAGYAEPDSSADVSGRDAAEKLAILLHLAGCEDVRPDVLTTVDIARVTAADLQVAKQLDGRLRPIAVANLDESCAGAWVGPAFVGAGHPLATLSGVSNALQVTTSRGHDVTFSGPGAGPDATAATIVDDIVEAVEGSASAFVRERGPARIASRRRIDLSSPPPGPWFISAPEGVGRECAIRARLATAGIAVRRTATAGSRLGLVTAPASWVAIRSAVHTLDQDARDYLLLPALDARPDASRS